MHQRDFIAQGTGLPDECVDYVMLFNILHHQDNSVLPKEAFRILKRGGKMGIIHWRSDIPTPSLYEIARCEATGIDYAALPDKTEDVVKTLLENLDIAFPPGMEEEHS